MFDRPCAVLFMAVAASGAVTAQTPPPTGLVPIFGARGAVSGTVTSINPTSGQITIARGNDAAVLTVQASAGTSGLTTFREGSEVRARVAENLVLAVRPKGEKPSRARTVAVEHTMTVSVTAIDRKASSIAFTGPNGWSYKWSVADRVDFDGIKVGDFLDITWASAVLTSVDCMSRCRK